MSSRSYSIVEPHPNPSPSAHYISTGRGGAGNAIRPPMHLTPGRDATGPAAAAAIRASLASSSFKATPSAPSVTSSSSTQRKYSMGGRGGAGNVFPSSERAIFSFDEELERQLRWERDAAPVYHVGRGGAGNLMRGAEAASSIKPVRRASEDSGVSMTSASSHGSASGADAFNRSVKKGWKKITGGY